MLLHNNGLYLKLNFKYGIKQLFYNKRDTLFFQIFRNLFELNTLVFIEQIYFSSGCSK